MFIFYGIGKSNTIEQVNWETIYQSMRADETLWIFVQNEHASGKLDPVALEIGEEIRERTDFILKNTITVHQWFDGNSNRGLANAYFEILFLVKDKREYTFNKDAIRVEHVYKGNEWGDNRESGKSSYHNTEVRRYNPEGRDPGNVWLVEDRTQTSGDELDETNPLPTTEAIQRCIRAGSEPHEEVHYYGDPIPPVATTEERNPSRIDIWSVQT